MQAPEDAEGALALADEAMARLDVDALVAHLSAAVRAFTAADQPCRAALCCARLGDVYATMLGNLNAGRAWYARAWRLVEHQPPCLEQGWVAVAAMGCDVDDPLQLQRAAELALDRARAFGDVNLETKALADGGLAQVQLGRVGEGMALLDEAMALVCGPADDVDVAAKSVCSFFTACYHAADFARADSWTGLLRRQGLIALEPGAPIVLSSHCDSVQAAMLMELGRWSEAEAVLVKAKHDFESLLPINAWHPDIALAELRIRQGRFADAEALLLGKDQAMEALLPGAHLHLARGDLAMARAVASRGLRVMGADRLRAAEVLTVLVDVELAAGDLTAATAACADLARRVAGAGNPVLDARAARARARVLGASGDAIGAVAVLDAALGALDPVALPWLRACLLVDLAELRSLAGDRSGATIDARAALAALEHLDVVLTPAQQATLERLGAAPDAPAGPPAATLTRLARGWQATHGHLVVHLADSKGLRYLAELLATPGQERHVLDLTDRVEGMVEAGQVSRHALGDAGELLDAQARSAYRRRIEELRVEADEAIQAGHLARAEAVQEELDALVRELARAFGLGGRDRKAASASERARLNVTRAVRAAIGRLAEALPDAAAILDRHVRTGTYCAYEPAPGEPRWVFNAE